MRKREEGGGEKRAKEEWRIRKRSWKRVGGEKWEEAVEGLLLTLRMMCLEGGASSSTCDLVTRP